MSMTVSVRLEHRASARAGGARRHDLRLGRIPKYVDRSRTHLNSVLIRPLLEGELKEIVQTRRTGKKRKLRADAAISTNGILTFGREAQPIINALPVEEQNRLCRLACEKVSEELNTELTGLVFHRDERAPHCHFQMPAWNRVGKPNSKVVTPKIAARLQDIVGEVFSHLGISRGKKKEARIEDGDDLSAIIHRSVKQLHEDLPGEIAEKEAIRNQIADQIVSLDGDLRVRIAEEIKDLPQFPSPEIAEIVTGRDGKNVLTKKVSFFRAGPVQKFLDSIAPRLAAEKIFLENFVPRRELEEVRDRLADKEKELETAQAKISHLESLVEKAKRFIKWVESLIPGAIKKFNLYDSQKAEAEEIDPEDSPGAAIERTP